MLIDTISDEGLEKLVNMFRSDAFMLFLDLAKEEIGRIEHTDNRNLDNQEKVTAFLCGVMIGIEWNERTMESLMRKWKERGDKNATEEGEI
jgi:hypothetical protein